MTVLVMSTFESLPLPEKNMFLTFWDFCIFMFSP